MFDESVILGPPLIFPLSAATVTFPEPELKTIQRLPVFASGTVMVVVPMTLAQKSEVASVYAPDLVDSADLKPLSASSTPSLCC